MLRKRHRVPSEQINELALKHSLRDILTFAIRLLPLAVVAVVCLLVVTSCARMGSPDGGWYDEVPPHVIATYPADREVNVTSRKIRIEFDEFIKVDNVAEKVVFSPPQREVPDIKARGRFINITLHDPLIENTTYTIDFSDAISDNNEGNSMPSYTYSFSTGDHIDTLAVEGYVLNAEDLEPVKGILVGLFPKDSLAQGPDTAFVRVSRTDSYGHFIIRGVAPGQYTAGAVMDMDGDSRFTQRGEQMAFSHDVFVPSAFPDIRQDTIWSDTLHIKDIVRVPYTHFKPDDIVLRAFSHSMTERYFLKSERIETDHFTFVYTSGLSKDSIDAYYARTDSTAKAALQKYDGPRLTALPTLRGLNFNADEALVIEPSEFGDTITYWIKDTTLIEKDSLAVQVITLVTDTLGTLQLETDTLELLPKMSLEKRLKERAKQQEEWQKEVERRKKSREKTISRLRRDEVPEEEWDLEPLDTLPAPKRLKVNYEVPGSMSPDGIVRITFPTPMARIDTSAVHLYVEQDSTWYRTQFFLQPVEQRLPYMGDNPQRNLSREWEMFTEWIPGANYSFEVDTLAFEDVYGTTSDPYKTGIRVLPLDSYSSLFVNVTGIPATSSSIKAKSDAEKQPSDAEAEAAEGAEGNAEPAPVQPAGKPQMVVQVLDSSDRVVRSAVVEKGTAELYYLKGGTFYLRAFMDRNGNGRWDSGDYYIDQQPEEVYYYPKEVELKEKWDITKTWNISETPLYRQKPGKLTKQKGEKKKEIRNRNQKRAEEKGIPLPEYLQ